MDKKKNLVFIRGFQNITLKNICEKEKISRSNVYSGLISTESSEIIKNEIIKEFLKICGELVK